MMASCVIETPSPHHVDPHLSHLHEKQLNFEHLSFALPNGVPSSGHSVTVTSASASANGGCATPSRKIHHIHIPSGSLDPASRAARNLDSLTSVEAHVGKLKHDLEVHYGIQANHRLQKFLTQHPAGVSEEESQVFKQKEAIERTKFVVYKDGQIAKLLNELDGVHQDPFASPTTPTPSSHHRGSTFTEHNPFKVNHQFPPPPRQLSRDRNFNYSLSCVSFGSMSSSNSGAGGGSSRSGMNCNNGSFPSNTEVTDSTTGWTREQILLCFQQVYDDVAATKNETLQLKSEISTLKQFLVALLGESDGNGDDIGSRINALESKLTAMQNGQPLESDNALVANLASDVAQLRVEVAKTGSDTLSRRAFDAESELTKMTFNNKCALIEKYLGIDITTTGPKPHDVLEALHRRIWNLEGFLNAEDPASKAGKQYRPLNDYMKTTLGKGNSMVNYSATPGYSGGGYSDSSSTHGGAAINDILVSNGFNSLSLSGLSSGNSLLSLQANNTQFSQAPVAPTKRYIGNGSFMPQMRFDPADVRSRDRAHIQGSQYTVKPDIASPSMTQSELTRSNTLPSLLPQGGAPLLPTGPRADWSAEKKGKFDFTKSPPHRPRGMSSGSTAFTVTSPKARKTGGHHSRTNSTSTTKEVTTADGAAPEKKTKDRAYHAWLNQRPGEFLGKKLSGLGQKE
jgi:hypothetical protein